MANSTNGSGAKPETNTLALLRYEPVADRLILLKPRDKRPLKSDWPNERNSFADVLDYMERGGNVGFRLGSGIYVLDWDKRNDPACDDPSANSITRLCRDHGLVLRDDAIVETGNGLHFYTESPPDLEALRNDIPKYPGVELKGAGRQVVCAGSVHPSGAVYRWRL